jgi:hypothetical protein
MWRAALVIAVSGCTTRNPQVVRGAPFGPQLCANGVPGSPRCPYNRVDLGLDAATGSEMTAIVWENDQSLSVTAIVITAGADGLYAENAGLDSCSGNSRPRWWIIDIAPGEKTALDSTLVVEPPICFAAEVVDGYRP